MALAEALPFGAAVGLAALLGLVWGSFAATLIMRWPAGQSVRGRSRCDSCHAALSARDLVPLLSAAAFRGRCRRCGAVISSLHHQVELCSALVGGLALAMMPGVEGWLWALFGWLLIPLAVLDARHFWLPDRLSGLLAVTGLLFAGPMLGTTMIDRWIGALVGGLTLAALGWAYGRLRGREGMGGGDPKLVAAIGAWIGWQALPLMLLVASLAGIASALVRQHKGNPPLAHMRVPFGLFASAAAWAAVPLWPLVSGQ